MRISALEEYGLRCLLSLAQVGPGGQLSISDIAEREGISVPYASKLLSLLRKTGLVEAVRGRSGGFSIARPASEITLFDVITALGGPLIDPDHCRKYSGHLDKCIHTGDCSVHHTLVGLSRLVSDFLGKTTLESIMNGSCQSDLTYRDGRFSIPEPIKDRKHRLIGESSVDKSQ
ncbi:MAG: Rrf2 family transcriptional regulator [Candidatus Zixiibacteriota bacterium]